MAAKEFNVVRKEMREGFQEISGEFKGVYKEFQGVYEEFKEVRKEMQDGFRAVLAAVETVEYTKLRMRIDALESDMERVKEKVRV